MSHCSTTATSTYILKRYSKSYPNQRDPQGAAAPQAISETNASEWQHFTNPTIRLALEIKQGKKELESVRLRIIWSMNSGDFSSMDQREVVFEDIDLLSLSCKGSQRMPQKQQQAQGLPLKAVYRDTVVGIRYLHGRDTATTPVFRRFQITFMCSSAVIEFIDAIRSVCPCKANPSTTGRDMTIDTRTATGIRAPMTTPSTDMTLKLPRTQISMIDSQAQFPPPQISTPPRPLIESRILIPSVFSETNNLRGPSVPVSRRPNADLFVTVGAGSQTAKILNRTSSYINHDAQGPQKQNILPSSSPPTSSNNVSLHVIDDAIFSSLRESTALYELPHSTLEKLVGDVVREDGFAKLMENVASMWKIRNYVGI